MDASTIGVIIAVSSLGVMALIAVIAAVVSAIAASTGFNTRWDKKRQDRP